MNIALMGAAPSSRLLGPFNNHEWEIWACSPGNHDFPRIDAWFELHSLDRKWCKGNEPYMAALERHSRVYIAAPDPRLPNAILYPKDEILAEYTHFHHTFFSSQIAWMFAMAIKQKPKSIGLWGIDMAAHDEDAYQRPGCHFFIGEAQKKGIDLVMPPQSDIGQLHPLYGYKEQWPMYWRQKARKIELRERLNNANKIIAEQTAFAQMAEGALQDVDYVNGTWLKP